MTRCWANMLSKCALTIDKGSESRYIGRSVLWAGSWVKSRIPSVLVCAGSNFLYVSAVKPFWQSGPLKKLTSKPGVSPAVTGRHSQGPPFPGAATPRINQIFFPLFLSWMTCVDSFDLLRNRRLLQSLTSLPKFLLTDGLCKQRHPYSEFFLFLGMAAPGNGGPKPRQQAINSKAGTNIYWTLWALLWVEIENHTF